MDHVRTGLQPVTGSGDWHHRAGRAGCRNRHASVCGNAAAKVNNTTTMDMAADTNSMEEVFGFPSFGFVTFASFKTGVINNGLSFFVSVEIIRY